VIAGFVDVGYGQIIVGDAEALLTELRSPSGRLDPPPPRRAPSPAGKRARPGRSDPA
jgi:hypothetical protein